ncbi:MAG TPA: Uma2 family endonuclease [Polyangiaceae bacterium]|jgi:Uma2 family endonuclease
MTDLARREPGPYTWTDFIALDDDDRRELIDGELVEVEVPTKAHERIVPMLSYYVVGWSLAHGGGEMLGSGYKLRIAERRGVMPDLQFYRRGNEPKGQPQGLVEGHPDLVVEIVSPSSIRYDRVIKMNWYASIGAQEYWIVDPSARTFERLVLDGSRYVIADALAGDDVFRPASFDGLEIPLAQLWSAADPRP